jgi:hypothetical protein
MNMSAMTTRRATARPTGVRCPADLVNRAVAPNVRDNDRLVNMGDRQPALKDIPGALRCDGLPHSAAFGSHSFRWPDFPDGTSSPSRTSRFLASTASHFSMPHHTAANPEVNGAALP